MFITWHVAIIFLTSQLILGVLTDNLLANFAFSLAIICRKSRFLEIFWGESKVFLRSCDKSRTFLNHSVAKIMFSVIIWRKSFFRDSLARVEALFVIFWYNYLFYCDLLKKFAFYRRFFRVVFNFLEIKTWLRLKYSGLGALAP